MQQQSHAMRTLQSLLLDTEEGRAAVWSCLHCSPLDRVHSVRPVITLLALQMSHRIVRQNRSTTTGELQRLPNGNGPVIRRVQSATLLVNWRD